DGAVPGRRVGARAARAAGPRRARQGLAVDAAFDPGAARPGPRPGERRRARGADASLHDPRRGIGKARNGTTGAAPHAAVIAEHRHLAAMASTAGGAFVDTQGPDGAVAYAVQGATLGDGH